MPLVLYTIPDVPDLAVNFRNPRASHKPRLKSNVEADPQIFAKLALLQTVTPLIELRITRTLATLLQFHDEISYTAINSL